MQRGITIRENEITWQNKVSLRTGEKLVIAETKHKILNTIQRILVNSKNNDRLMVRLQERRKIILSLRDDTVERSFLKPEFSPYCQLVYGEHNKSSVKINFPIYDYLNILQQQHLAVILRATVSVTTTRKRGKDGAKKKTKKNIYTYHRLRLSNDHAIL